MKLRIRGGFSDRNKIKPINNIVQTDYIDNDSRVVLRNEISEMIEKHSVATRLSSWEFEQYFKRKIAKEVFNLPIDEHSYHEITDMINEVFDTGDYDDVLTLIEYFANNIDVIGERDIFGTLHFRDNFSHFNTLFEKENIGYRFIDDKIVPIYEKEEVSSITEACQTKYDRVNIHIQNAVEEFSLKGNKNYKKVISECCQGLECLLNIVLGAAKLTLGEATNKYFSSKPNLHPALKESISRLYGFASDSAGIRHDSNTKEYEVGFDETKLILVNVSALINYIISKEE